MTIAGGCLHEGRGGAGDSGGHGHGQGRQDQCPGVHCRPLAGRYHTGKLTLSTR